MFCEKCGKELRNGKCLNCGENSLSKSQSKLRCLPSFILGLIGSIFGLMGGVCTTMCSFGSSSNNAFVLIFGGSLVGLIGSCLCLNKAKLGSVLEAVASIMIIYRAFFKGGADFMTVVALLLLLSGSIIGIIYSFVLKHK